MREPFIARWKGRIQPGQLSTAVASTLDILPTLAHLTGGLPKENPTLDGADLAPLLWGNGTRPQPDFFYYTGGRLRAIRRGPWKLHLVGENWELYNVETDIAERFNVAAAHSGIVTQLKEAIATHQASFQHAETQR